MTDQELEREWRYLVGPSMTLYATPRCFTDDGVLIISVNDVTMLRVLELITVRLAAAWNARPWTPPCSEIVLLNEPQEAGYHEARR